jgi:hypothetical protein
MTIPALIAFVAIAVAGFTALIFLSRSRTRAPHRRFGRPRGIRPKANRPSSMQPETGLDARRETAEDFRLQQFSSAEHARYAEVHAQYAESPGGAVTEADQGLSDVLSMSGCLVSDFEQCGADIFIHASALTRDCVIHEIALRKRPGRGGADELRRTLIRYRTLLETPPAGWRQSG